MKLDAKIPNKIVANWMQWYVKRIRYHDPEEFISRMQAGNNIWKLINGVHHINRERNKNHVIISIDAKASE